MPTFGFYYYDDEKKYRRSSNIDGFNSEIIADKTLIKF